jgi:hypothetical protein
MSYLKFGKNKKYIVSRKKRNGKKNGKLSNAMGF